VHIANPTGFLLRWIMGCGLTFFVDQTPGETCMETGKVKEGND
jgi:hypothetical protein